MEPRITKRQDLVHPDLSYTIIGAVFKVYNQLGWGQKEMYYGRALAEEFRQLGLKFEKEKIIPLRYGDKVIGKYVLDFLVEERVVVELKVRPRIGYTHIKQVVAYLVNQHADLAIIVYFMRDGVKYRRVLAPLLNS